MYRSIYIKLHIVTGIKNIADDVLKHVQLKESCLALLLSFSDYVDVYLLIFIYLISA